MPKMDESLIGQWVKFTHEIHKSRKKNYATFKSLAVVNQAIVCHEERKTYKNGRGMLIGERYAQDGDVYYDSMSDSLDVDDNVSGYAKRFVPNGTTRYLLVVESPQKNPIKVAIRGTRFDGGPFDGVSVANVLGIKE